MSGPRKVLASGWAGCSVGMQHGLEKIEDARVDTWETILLRSKDRLEAVNALMFEEVVVPGERR